MSANQAEGSLHLGIWEVDDVIEEKPSGTPTPLPQSLLSLTFPVISYTAFQPKLKTKPLTVSDLLVSWSARDTKTAVTS